MESEYRRIPKVQYLQSALRLGPRYSAYFVLTPHFEELLDRFGDASTDCAHNQYIGYLLTQGALGLAAYLGFMGAIIIRGIKAATRRIR